MAKKRKNQERKPPREYNRHQLARWQKQKRRQRLITIIAATVITAVIAIAVSGWYIGEYRPLNQPAIKVNDTEFKMKYFVDMLEFSAGTQSESVLYSLSGNVITNIVRNELIKRGAAELGITVDRDEVTQQLKEFEIKDDRIRRDLVGNQLLLEKLRDDYFDKQVPVNAPQRQVMAMLLEDEANAANVTSRLDAGEDFSELAGELSLDTFSRVMKGDFGWHPEGIIRDFFTTNSTADFVLSAPVRTVSGIFDGEVYKSVGYWLVQVLTRDLEGEEATAYGMLLGSEEEAREVLTRLEEGEDFGDLAAEFSRLPNAEENRGDLGTILRGQYPPVVDDYVFTEDTEPGVVSPPLRDSTVSTQGGYWIVFVADEDSNRLIDEEDRAILVDEALNEWVSSLFDNPDYVIDTSYLTENEENLRWAVERVAL